MNRRIAIVEDERDQRENCADALRRQGYEVETYANRAEAQRGFERRLPDLAILDVMLEDENEAGFELCKAIRARAPRLPVLFLTARDSEMDRISGLRLDAWDYLTKPITLDYLIVRVSSLFRIADALHAPPEKGAAADFAHGDLRLNADSMSLRWKGRPVELTLTEFWIVESLARRPGHVCGYDELMQVTRHTIVEKNTINGHIRRIRGKFKAVDARFDSIRNVFGVGYRWAVAPAPTASAQAPGA